MDEPLRIMHVVDSLETGGLERVVVDLAIAQQASGHLVTVFSIEATNGFRHELEAAAVPVLCGDKRRMLDRGVLRSLRTAARRASVLHTHNFVPSYYAAIATLAMRSAPVLVNSCHNMGVRLENRRLRWLYRMSLRRTACVAMVSRQVRDRLVELGIVSPERAAIVLNGIPVERFSRQRGTSGTARTALGLDAGDLVIGCVGRLVPVKNHAALIAELPALSRRYPNLRVVLLGEGPLADSLRTQAAALGVAGRVLISACADVATVLPAFDVYAQPSLSEGMSIALLEACASGLAIVATRVGGNPDIITDGRNGMLVPANDGRALRAALDGLLGDAERRARLGAAAAEWAASNASISFMHDAYDTLYRDAIARARYGVTSDVSASD
jgi:glycosyltransferase involved in cell wall biosynthesis